MVPGSEIQKDLIEGADVVGSVIGWQRDAGEKNLYMRFFERGEHLIEIGARLGDRQAAQSIVATELDNYDGGVKAQYFGERCERILGGGTAGAPVNDVVSIATRVEQLLKEVRISLALLKTQTGGDAVAEADQNWPTGIGWTGSRERAGRQQQQTNGDENESPGDHVSSVASRTYQTLLGA